jgi:serine/threonine protein kinase
MNAEELAQFYTHLGTLLNCSSDEALVLVKGYQRGTSAFFERYFARLTGVVLNDSPQTAAVEEDEEDDDEDANEYSKEASRRYKEYWVGEKQRQADMRRENVLRRGDATHILLVSNRASKGEHSEFMKNRTNPLVYKLVTQNPWEQSRDMFLKSLFREVIVQTLLQRDRTHGQHICKLLNVYRSGPSILLQMEPLHMTKYHMLLKLIGEKEGEYTIVERNRHSEIAKQIIIETFTIVKYFHEKYGFVHWDLHLKNIMNSADGTIKLIDFGLSLVIIDGAQIGRLYEANQDTYRLMWHIETLNVLYKKNVFSKAFTTLLERLQTQSHGQPFDYYIDELSTNPIINAVSGGRRRTRRKGTYMR